MDLPADVGGSYGTNGIQECAGSIRTSSLDGSRGRVGSRRKAPPVALLRGRKWYGWRPVHIRDRRRIHSRATPMMDLPVSGGRSCPGRSVRVYRVISLVHAACIHPHQNRPLRRWVCSDRPVQAALMAGIGPGWAAALGTGLRGGMDSLSPIYPSLAGSDKCGATQQRCNDWRDCPKTQISRNERV